MQYLQFEQALQIEPDYGPATAPEYGLYVSYSQGFRAPAFLELTCAGPGAISIDALIRTVYRRGEP